MRKVISVVLCIVMLLCMTPTTAFAMTPTDVYFTDSVTNEPKDLYYAENVSIVAGGALAVDVTPTKGRALRVWLLNKDTPTQLRVSRPAFIGYSIVFDETYGVGSVDVETVSNCNGGTYQVQVWNKSGEILSNISILIYETGG